MSMIKRNDDNMMGAPLEIAGRDYQLRVLNPA